MVDSLLNLIALNISYIYWDWSGKVSSAYIGFTGFVGLITWEKKKFCFHFSFILISNASGLRHGCCSVPHGCVAELEKIFYLLMVVNITWGHKNCLFSLLTRPLSSINFFFFATWYHYKICGYSRPIHSLIYI